MYRNSILSAGEATSTPVFAPPIEVVTGLGITLLKTGALITEMVTKKIQQQIIQSLKIGPEA